uniref:hypothetical protein n=1 Tax=Streptomyces winkii TaxID=3051178 RepID=UPI0028D2C1D9|nr:hypothetical protein [Streptomyces sp. DSM 40971]
MGRPKSSGAALHDRILEQLGCQARVVVMPIKEESLVPAVRLRGKLSGDFTFTLKR